MNMVVMAKLRPAARAGSELVPTRRTLLERLRDLDDQDSWQEFFDTYWKLLYCAAIKAGLTDAEAEDAVQETIIGVARKMPGFRYEPGHCSFKGWLMHITRRRIIDHWRKRQKNQAQPLPSDTSTGESELQLPDSAAERAFAGVWEQEWESNLTDAAMERVRRTADPQHYQIFYLHTVKNMPAREVGQLLGVSVAKVYVVKHRIALLVRRSARMLERKWVPEHD